LENGFVPRFRRTELTFDFFVTLAVAVGLSCLTYFFAAVSLTKDGMVPFRSVSFGLGTGAIFFVSVMSSARQGLYLSVSMLILIGMVWGLFPDNNKMTFIQMAVELPLIGLFFAGLSLLPNLLPWILERETSQLAAQNKLIEGKLTDLRKRSETIQQKEVIDRSAKDRKEQVRLSSRIAFLNAFAREILQSTSAREALNVMFHNLTKLLGIDECLLLVIHTESQEAAIVRALHPNYETLENTRVPADNPVISQILSTGRSVDSPTPATFLPGVISRYIFPILSEGEVVAICNLGVPKGNDLLPEDRELVDIMALIVSGVTDQLKTAMQ